MGPSDLGQVLSELPQTNDERVLVGCHGSDDAGVYRLSDDTAIVQTVDFITPIVDDPRDFGAIAAANAISDIYAMGATPLFALNVVAFPRACLPLSVLVEILRGGGDKAAEAGISIIGGHTVNDDEPKYGLCVTGIVHPDRVLTNAGAEPGDALVLTKPIGSGIISTAAKRDQCPAEWLDEAVRVMSTLSRTAAEVAAGFPVHACTDVTGFGLLGHLREMAHASGVNAEVVRSAVPLLPGIAELDAEEFAPGGTERNLAALEEHVEWDESLRPADRLVLCDAQTSGGLLLAVPPEVAADLVAALRSHGVAAASIGRCLGRGDGAISARA